MSKKYLFGSAAALLLLSSTTSTALAASNYTVKSGDTLYSISRATNVPVATLKSLNTLKTDSILVGQKLNLVATSTSTTKPSTSTPTTSTPTTSSTYKVKAGDTLFKIATTYKTTVANLTSLNNLKSTSISVGQVLVVSKATTSAPSTITNTSTSTTYKEGTVNASSLNVRASASTSGKLLGQLSLGTKVTIVSTVSGWYNVKSAKLSGWVSASYIKLSSASTTNSTPNTTNNSSGTITNVITTNNASANTTLPSWGVVTATSLNLRGMPNVSSVTLTSIPLGKSVSISNQSGDWYKVTYNGVTGWVSKNYIKPSIPSTNSKTNTDVNQSVNVNNSNVANTSKSYEVRSNGGLNLRNAATTSSNVLTVLPNGAKVTMIEYGSSWHKVKYGNFTGYVSSTYIGEVVQNSNTTNTTNSGLTYRASNSKHLVVLDPGHGGVDPGAVNGKYYESTYTIDLAKKTKAYLESIGYQVLLTRTSSSCTVPYVLTPDLQCRVNVSNNNNAGAFVSFHINSAIPGAIGTETYYSPNSTASYESSKLANEIHSEYQPAFGSTNRGVRPSDFYVLRYNKAPSTLIEVGFLSDTRDLARLNNASTMNNVAKAVAKGIDDYFN